MSPAVSLMPMARRTDGGTVPTGRDRREPRGFSAIGDGAAGHVVDIRSVGQKPRLAVCARGRPRDRGDARAGPPHNAFDYSKTPPPREQQRRVLLPRLMRRNTIVQCQRNDLVFVCPGDRVRVNDDPGTFAHCE